MSKKISITPTTMTHKHSSRGNTSYSSPVEQGLCQLPLNTEQGL